MKITIAYTEAEAMQAAGIVQQLRESLPPVRVKCAPGDKYYHYYITGKKQIDSNGK